MTETEIVKLLIKLHQQRFPRNHSNKDSQMCTFWSINNPPDTLEGTKALETIETALDMTFEEEDAVEFYDMNIENAAAYIYDLMKKNN